MLRRDPRPGCDEFAGSQQGLAPGSAGPQATEKPLDRRRRPGLTASATAPAPAGPRQPVPVVSACGTGARRGGPAPGAGFGGGLGPQNLPRGSAGFPPAAGGGEGGGRESRRHPRHRPERPGCLRLSPEGVSLPSGGCRGGSGSGGTRSPRALRDAGHVPGLAAGERERVPAVLAEPSEHRDVRPSVPPQSRGDRRRLPMAGDALRALPNHSINWLWLNPPAPRGAVCPTWVPGKPGAPCRGAGDLPYPSPGQREPVPAPSLGLGVQMQPTPPRLSAGKLICPQRLS